ncbi:MAG TPA: VOC family protein [Candidatus Dormibacteraeota bacterium]
MYVGSVVIDCNDLRAMSAFWQHALGYVPRDPSEGDFTVLEDPSGGHVNVSLQVVPEHRVGKNRLHLDLYTDTQAEEVRRLLELGATLHPRLPEPGDDFILLQDPEGNVFCVVDMEG